MSCASAFVDRGPLGRVGIRKGLASDGASTSRTKSWIDRGAWRVSFATLSVVKSPNPLAAAAANSSMVRSKSWGGEQFPAPRLRRQMLGSDRGVSLLLSGRHRRRACAIVQRARDAYRAALRARRQYSLRRRGRDHRRPRQSRLRLASPLRSSGGAGCVGRRVRSGHRILDPHRKGCNFFSEGNGRRLHFGRRTSERAFEIVDTVT